MNLTIEYKEIEAFILAKTGLDIAIRCVDENEIRFQPCNMGFVKNRVKVSVRIDRTYTVPNRLKLFLSGGVLSKIVVTKIMALLDHMPKGSIARQTDGTIYLMLDKIPQLKDFCEICEITEVKFDKFSQEIAVNGCFSELSDREMTETSTEKATKSMRAYRRYVKKHLKSRMHMEKNYTI